jgi:hypothetical protein
VSPNRKRRPKRPPWRNHPITPGKTADNPRFFRALLGVWRDEEAGDISMSMQLSLTPHPDTPCSALSVITATIVQAEDGKLLIEYAAVGRVDNVLWPKPAKAERTDGLWQSSCFELFVSAPDTRAYQEFNFSPSTAWAAYQFEDYRDVMTELLMLQKPNIKMKNSDLHFTLNVLLKLFLPARARIGLSAVIEETDGTKSYWALAHPPGKPDFHHRDCFAHQLSAADET